MAEPVVVKLFFNFRSPYCYLASKHMFDVFEDFDVDLEWYPLGGWDGRSPPDVAKVRVPAARQDMQRWGRRMGVPVVPPPSETEPTLAGMGSYLALEKGLLKEYVSAVMKAEWGRGVNIGEAPALLDLGESVGLNRDELSRVITDSAYNQRLIENWKIAQSLGVFGVPSFLVGDEFFWGNDRIEFLRDYLTERRLRKI